MIRAMQGAPEASIELTPMIDMVFLLLIFFLVATTFHQSEREIKVALPDAAAATPISVALREMVVTVDADGAMFLGARAVTAEELREAVERAAAANPGQKVAVRADRATAYANVVRVLDICKGAGIQQPYLDTIPAR